MNMLHQTLTMTELSDGYEVDFTSNDSYYFGTSKATNKKVAIRQITEADGKIVDLGRKFVLDIMAAKHRGILNVLDVCFTWRKKKLTYFLVFEEFKYSLAAILAPNRFSRMQKKALMKQLLSTLSIFPYYNIVHCDVKPSNILLTEKGEVKLTSGRPARLENTELDSEMQEDSVEYSWFVAPEMLFREHSFTCSLDIWAVGWVMLSLWCSLPDNKFGSNEQLQYYYSIFDTDTNSFVEFAKKDLEDDEAFDLINQMIRFKASDRITAEEALKHPFFSGKFSRFDLVQAMAQPL